jgi:hypothetical protein
MRSRVDLPEPERFSSRTISLLRMVTSTTVQHDEIAGRFPWVGLIALADLEEIFGQGGSG